MLQAGLDHDQNDQKALANEMRMTKKPKMAVPINAFSSLKVFIARIAAMPTTGTVIIPVTYPRTQIPPCRENRTTIKNGTEALAIRKSSAINFRITDDLQSAHRQMLTIFNLAMLAY